MSKSKTTPSIKKPKFVLTNEAKFYLATRELSNENGDGLYFIASLFLPVKNGSILAQAYNEVATFDDADSAMIYRETVANLCQVNLTTTAVGREFAKIAEEFKENTR